VDEQIRRLIDEVYGTILDNEEEFLRAEGMAVVRVLKQGDVPRITLDSRKMLVRVGGANRASGSARLGGDVRRLADDVRRGMIAEEMYVHRAREIVIEIHLGGPRSTFELGYKGRKTS
jgi:hypothetical protein